MTELEVKLVKVDNWGIFFLQRLKHFFNRTDYCDLTLQFQDNAQLKVHRLVLSACTEYFELLERTCEMYEDCLVMPDDLQADVVVPIVNFMYTGQLEFRIDLLERLYQTSQIMNMPVLTKLLETHRNQVPVAPLKPPSLNYSSIKRSYSKPKDTSSRSKIQYSSSSNNSSQPSNKRSHAKAFGNPVPPYTEFNKKSMIASFNKTNEKYADLSSPSQSYSNLIIPSTTKKVTLGEPRPTRYELPEELDTDNVFDSSFSSISYSSQPLIIHPESEKESKSKRSSLFGDSFECTKVPKRENIFDDDDLDPLDTNFIHESKTQVSNHMFDQVVDQSGPKVTIETKDSKQASNIDHAKIISEVLKKYPHLVKSNKNIKLKILNTPSPTPAVYKPRSKKQQQICAPTNQEEKPVKTESDYTYQSDVLDSKEAARLIAMGAENVRGPWICLICGTPGKALHFSSYYKFRRHLVEVHKEKPIINMCEYCGLKSLKRNYLLHHLLTRHGVTPPPTYNFPKCNICDYVALTESLLVKHKHSHGADNRRFHCNVCVASFSTSKELLAHIQVTGHKYCDRKTNLQCVYCQKVFLRESNLFAHLKTYHKQVAKSDGIIEDSDEETQEQLQQPVVKYEPQNFEEENDDVETQYTLRPDGNLELISKKINTSTAPQPRKQKILNTGFGIPAEQSVQKLPIKNIPHTVQKHISNEEIVMIGNNEYIMKDNHLIPKKRTGPSFVVPEILSTDSDENLSSEYAIQETIPEHTLQEHRMIVKKTSSMNQPIQIVVSNEEEYKALMNSNHSVIFDNGDASKTLTVLSTPETAAAMNTTLELENTQPTDMMIIPNNYPINVSQGIAAESSNIVVVYSHPIDEQGKQFQIISSGDIGAEFVQSSPVITSNFQTVTTSACIKSVQGVELQTAETWSNNIQVGSQRNDEIQELHEISIGDQTEIESSNAIASDVLSGLPEVSLTSIVPQEVNEVVLTENITESEESHTIQDNDHIDMPENISSNPRDDDNISCSNVEVSADIESTSSEIIPQDSTSNKMVAIGEQEHSDVAEREILIEENPREQSSEIDKGDLSQNRDKGAENIEECVPETNEYSQEYKTTEVENHDVVLDPNQVPPAIDDNISKTVPIEIMHNLTSKWSEDDDDGRSEKSKENIIQPNIGIALVAEESRDMEESIENIQQEVDKSVTEVTKSVIDSEIDNLTETHEQPSTAMQVVAPHEEISSILNDWDENESQEGNESASGTEDTVHIEVVEGETGNVPIEGLDNKKDDKIQSLVSDWDDDEEEEENKE